MPIVSVLMPVFNGEEYLAEAIESILNQSLTDFEFIICNDASTDNSKNIIGQFNDPRIRIIENTVNLGIVETRNKLFQYARGEFLAIMDCDDIAHFRKLETQIRFLQKHKEYGLCGTWAKKINTQMKNIGFMQPPIKHEDIKINLLFQSSFIQSSVVIRKSILDQERYSTDFQVAEDYDLWERLSHKTVMYNIPQFLLFYRWHSTNISQEKAVLMQKNRATIITRQLNDFITYTEEELQRHIEIGNLLHNPEESMPDTIQRADQWLKKLIICNKNHHRYNPRNFEAFIWYRRTFFCIYFKQYFQAFTPNFISLNLCVLTKFIKLLSLKTPPIRFLYSLL